jgi:hypothetical protein
MTNPTIRSRTPTLVTAVAAIVMGALLSLPMRATAASDDGKCNNQWCATNCRYAAGYHCKYDTSTGSCSHSLCNAT